LMKIPTVYETLSIVHHVGLHANLFIHEIFFGL
jgi:hypothetical protein